MTKFKIGDRVVKSDNHSIYGIVCALASFGRQVQVSLQPPYSKLWWYDADELEIFN